MIAVGVIVLLCLLGMLRLCVSSDRARDAADLALEDAVLEADRLRTELRARDEEVELLRAAVVASEGRRRAAILHARRTRNALTVTQEQLVAQSQAAHAARCQRDAARSEAARARHEQVVLPRECARARGSEMPS